jgi:hypothetical protein
MGTYMQTIYLIEKLSIVAGTSFYSFVFCCSICSTTSILLAPTSCILEHSAVTETEHVLVGAATFVLARLLVRTPNPEPTEPLLFRIHQDALDLKSKSGAPPSKV